MKLDSYLIDTKIKMDERLKISAKNIELSHTHSKKCRFKLHNSVLGNGFLNITPNAQEVKEKKFINRSSPK